jgi:hypothetical protein
MELFDLDAALTFDLDAALLLTASVQMQFSAGAV